MEHTIGRVLLSRDQIASRIRQMGEQVTARLQQESDGTVTPEEQGIVLIPILTGALLFVADLMRHIPLKLSINPVTITSYPGTATESQGAAIKGGIPTDLTGQHVLVVDDILDTGRTLGLLRRLIQVQRPASVQLVVLLSKSKVRDEDVPVDHIGFEIEDEFVIGYGLDFDGYYRNLPDICVLA